MHGASGVSSMNIWIAGAILFFCIVASALFSGTETAMTAASRARMHALEKQGDQRAAIVNRLLAGRDRLIGAMLLGNTLFNIGSSALLTTVLVAMVGESGALYATAAMTVLLLVFAEVLPKTIAINYPGPDLARGVAGLFLLRDAVRPGPLRGREGRARRALPVRPAARREAPAALAAGGAEKRGRPDAQGGRRRPLRPRHVRRPARPQGAGRLRRHGPSHQDGRARRRRAHRRPRARSRGLALYPRAALARHGRTISSGCCTPRTCCGP